MSAPITLQGRLTSDPELRFTTSGTAVCKFTIVTSRRFKDNGEWVEKDTTFWDCTAFKQMAENIAESLRKGDDVVAAGRAMQESWEDKTTGAKRSKIAVLVDSIGPSLKWATAKSGRAARASEQPASADDPWATAAPAATSRIGGDDEPPF